MRTRYRLYVSVGFSKFAACFYAVPGLAWLQR